MLNVTEVLQSVPHFEKFASVDKLHGLVERVRADSRFDVHIAGTSARGVPIYHVRYGRGAVKALFVAFPHCMEPIGGLTVFSLMSLLYEGNRELCAADVEWNIVPCIDPDGAILNEGWSQNPFTLESFMRNFYLQAAADQVDTSFPITYKRLVLDGPPAKEASVLKEIIDRVKPDFFFSLHNAWTGGAFYHLSRGIGREYYQQLHSLLHEHGFPLQRRPMWREVCDQLAEGVLETWTIKKYYDYLERTVRSPEQLVHFGAASWDYLEEIKPDALTFVAEMGYVRHPADESEKSTGINLRQFKLRVDANSKFLASIIVEEWEKVKEEVDTESALYRAVIGGKVFPEKEKICEGGEPISRYPTRDVLLNPQYNRTMTEGDRFQAVIVDGGFFFLLLSYQFVRLLKESVQTASVRDATERLERAFKGMLEDIRQDVDFDAFRIFDCDTLAKVQLGSGLIVLNSLLEHGKRDSVNAPNENIGARAHVSQ